MGKLWLIIYAWLTVVFIWDHRIYVSNQRHTLIGDEILLSADSNIINQITAERNAGSGVFGFYSFTNDSVSWTERGNDSETMARWKLEPNNPKIGYRILTWKDFKEDSSKMEANVGAHTVTSSSIVDADVDGKVNFVLYFDFVDTMSGTRTNLFQPLMHERTHYFISWLIFRKFKKELDRLQGMDASRREFVIRLYNWRAKQAKEENDKFDEDSHNGCWFPEEIRWEKKVRDELKKITNEQ